MANTYDFYKPQLDSEYPKVDGPLTLITYLGALETSYNCYRKKVSKSYTRVKENGVKANGHTNGTNGHANDASGLTIPLVSLNDFDYPAFHSPYCKLVQKGHARLVKFLQQYCCSRNLFLSSYIMTICLPPTRTNSPTLRLLFEV